MSLRWCDWVNVEMFVVNWVLYSVWWATFLYITWKIQQREWFKNKERKKLFINCIIFLRDGHVVHFWKPTWVGWIWARESSARWHQLTLQLKQNTQTCPGASTLHLQCSWWMEVIQLCPSTFVFVYPYRSKAWFNSPEISHGISRCCIDLCDPSSSTVMICVCAVACWGVATLAASFSPAQPVSNAQTRARGLGHEGSLTQLKPDELENS